MKAKAIKKRLMRGRTEVLWGRRAYLTVTLPLSLVPTPEPPAPVFPGYHYVDDGHWRSDANPETEGLAIQFLTSGGPPSEKREPWEAPHFVEQRSIGWSWWEGFTVKDPTGPGEDFVREPLAEEPIAIYRALSRWRGAIPDAHPLVSVFCNLFHPKAIYWSAKGDTLRVTYAVKWFYPETKHGFATELARAMRAAKRQGVRARVVRVEED